MAADVLKSINTHICIIVLLGSFTNGALCSSQTVTSLLQALSQALIRASFKCRIKSNATVFSVVTKIASCLDAVELVGVVVI